MNLLFVCTMARMRSKTAAYMFGGRCAGTDKNADSPLTQENIEWADKIICMENCHRDKIRKKFKAVSHKIIVWDLKDEYDYMDDTLCHLIRSRMLKWGFIL